MSYNGNHPPPPPPPPGAPPLSPPTSSQQYSASNYPGGVSSGIPYGGAALHPSGPGLHHSGPPPHYPAPSGPYPPPPPGPPYPGSAPYLSTPGRPYLQQGYVPPSVWDRPGVGQPFAAAPPPPPPPPPPPALPPALPPSGYGPGAYGHGPPGYGPSGYAPGGYGRPYHAPDGGYGHPGVPYGSTGMPYGRPGMGGGYSYDIEGKRIRARNAFRSCDTNRDGTLDPREFMEVLKSLGVTISYQDALAVFANVDQDMNGRIGENEFVDYYVANHH